MRAVAYHVPLSLVSSAVAEEREGVAYFRLKNGVLAKRVHVWGVVVGRLVGDEYVRLTLDDLSGTAGVVFFDPPPEVKGVDVGDSVDVVGRLRVRNDEVGVVGETLRVIAPEVELLRRLENAAFVLNPRTAEESVPPPVKKDVRKERAEEEELEVETLDLEGNGW